MSLFNSVRAPCPACGTENPLQLVASVNADRRPDLRQQILDESFQREACSNCRTLFRYPPMLTYIDVGRRQWILVQPAGKRADWQALENQARTSFALAYGPAAPPAARELGQELRVRVAFGWSGLREKLLCAEHGLDDVELELLKMAVMRNTPGTPIEDDKELRLIGVEGEDLLLAWIEGENERIALTLRVPKEIYDDIAADEAGWQALRQQFKDAPYTDINRMLV